MEGKKQTHRDDTERKPETEMETEGQKERQKQINRDGYRERNRKGRKNASKGNAAKHLHNLGVYKIS